MSRSALLCAALFVACGGRSSGPPRSPLPSEGGKPGPAAKLEDIRGTLVSIDLVGLPEERAAAARSALRGAVGAPFDQAQAASDLRALWALGSIADARAEARLVQGGVALRYTIREQPRIGGLEVQGSKSVPAAQWVAQMPIKSGELFDPVKLAMIRRGMVDRLRELGFFNAKVAWKTAQKKDAVDVTFGIEEGRLVALTKVQFRGNKAVPRKTLLDLLAKSDGSAVGGRYWRGALERGLARVNEHYHDMGYVSVSIGSVEEALTADGGSMAIVVPIREGAQFRLGDLEVKGALVAPESEYVARLGLRTGQVFSRSKVAEGIEKIRELHRGKGQPNPDVVPVTEIDAKKKRIKLTLQVIPPRK